MFKHITVFILHEIYTEKVSLLEHFLLGLIKFLVLVFFCEKWTLLHIVF